MLADTILERVRQDLPDVVSVEIDVMSNMVKCISSDGEFRTVTMEQIVSDRLRNPTWDDVDKAYRTGYDSGWRAHWSFFRSRRRRRLINVGCYLQLRTMQKELGVSGR